MQRDDCSQLIRMIYRILIPTDAAEFQAIRLRGLQECPEAFASSYEEEVDTPLSTIELRLTPKEQAAVFGAFDGDRLIAIVGLARETFIKFAHKGFIWGMYVAPESRQRGCGAGILRFACAHAIDTMKVRQVNLGVNTKNSAALKLYQKLGFEQFGLERDFLFYDGVFHDEYQMVWRASNAV